ncbi:MAG TPA: hypothetical protein VFZ97_20160, partial [Acidimicrobiales bacterium]
MALIAGITVGVLSGPAPADVPTLTGTFYGSDNGVYYLQQNGNDVWWMGESVDAGKSANQVFSRGLDSTNVFHGTVQGSTLVGKWVEVSRGTSLGAGTISLTIGTFSGGGFGPAALTLASGTFRGSTTTRWLQGKPVNDFNFISDNTTLYGDFYNRFLATIKSGAADTSTGQPGYTLGDTHNPDDLRPYRDQTVFYGELRTRNYSSDETPHANIAPGASRDISNFCNVNDGDLDLRMAVDTGRLPTDFPGQSLAKYDPGFGWGSTNATDEGENGYDHQDVLPKLLNVG